MKFAELNKLVLQSSLLTVVFLALIGSLLFFVFGLSWISSILFCLGTFLVVFLVFRNSFREFILRQLRKVYDSSLFENEPHLKKEARELDFELFLSEVKKITENKVAEIERLNDRDDFRKDFMGDVSHELKTPLFTAQGYLLTVLEGSMEDPELERKYLSRARKSLDRLSSIVNDLDTLAKLESGLKLDQKVFNVVQCIHDVTDMLEFSADKKNITLGFGDSYDYPIMVKADKEKIEQVLINLIQNSINYGRIGGSTTIRIKSHSTHRILVEIEDDGVGIDSSNLSRLFERFYRVDKSRSRDHGGSGLGLAIVKHILEAHEQEIKVRSTPGKGSCFSFTLNKSD